VIDSAFVDPRILGDAVAHMLRSMQEDNPQKEVTVHIKWRKLARHAITTVDGEPIADMFSTIVSRGTAEGKGE